MADAIEHNNINPANISSADATVILDRFCLIIKQSLPNRRNIREWLPLWHLANDNAWSFFDGTGHNCGPTGLLEGWQPTRRDALLRIFTRIAVPDDMESAWNSPQARAQLRHRVIDVLRHDAQQYDPQCNTIADNLRT